MTKKDKFGDFFGRTESAKPKAKKPVGLFGTASASASTPKDETEQQTAKPFFATPEEAQQEREERERQRLQKLEDKRLAKQRNEKQAHLAREEKERQRQAKIDARETAKKRKLEEARAYKLKIAKAKKGKAFIRQEEKIIAQQKREDAKTAAQAKKYGHTPRGSRFYPTEKRQEALNNFKKYGTTERPLQPNMAMVRKVLDIYAQIEL